MLYPLEDFVDDAAVVVNVAVESSAEAMDKAHRAKAHLDVD